jgi:hypothetical protein
MYVANFARTLGAKDKSQRRRRSLQYGEAGLLGVSTATAGTIGYKAANRLRSTGDYLVDNLQKEGNKLAKRAGEQVKSKTLDGTGAVGRGLGQKIDNLRTRLKDAVSKSEVKNKISKSTSKLTQKLESLGRSLGRKSAENLGGGAEAAGYQAVNKINNAVNSKLKDQLAKLPSARRSGLIGAAALGGTTLALGSAGIAGKRIFSTKNSRAKRTEDRQYYTSQAYRQRRARNIGAVVGSLGGYQGSKLIKNKYGKLAALGLGTVSGAVAGRSAMSRLTGYGDRNN